MATRSGKRLPVDGPFPTIRGVDKRLGGGFEKKIRRAVRANEIALYQPEGTGWPRVSFDEVVAWIRRARVPATKHAEDRLREVLEREGRAG